MNTRYSFRVFTFRLFDDLWDCEYIYIEKKKKSKSVEIIPMNFPYDLTLLINIRHVLELRQD